MNWLPVSLRGLIKVFLFHLLLFFFIRILFVLTGRNQMSDDTGFSLIARMFVMGLRFDVAALCYIFAPAFLLICLSEILALPWLLRTAAWFLRIALPLMLLISCADIPYFLQFQKHLDGTFFTWFTQGTLSLRLIVSHFAYWGYFFLFLPLAGLSWRSVSRNINVPESKEGAAWHKIALTLVFGLLLMFAGARGRFSVKSPIHPGVAYISDDLLVNQAGLNASFVFFNSLIYPVMVCDAFEDTELEKSLQLTKRSLGIELSDTQFVREVKAADTIRGLNVVVVLMESMSRYKTGHLCNKVLAPQLMKLASEGIFFSSFYSAGIHTYNGIFSTVTGYPAVLHQHMMETYVHKKFSSLPELLRVQGYRTMFFTSHDDQFDNMGGFLRVNGVEKIYTDEDYPDNVQRATLGIPDHELFDFSIARMSEANEPFFSLILTSSDHGPWDIPKNIPFTPDQDLPEDERAAQYADWSIARFVASAKKQKWFNNTLFVFLADHGGAHGSTYDMDIQFNYIPCILYSPNQLKPAIYTSPGMQIDVLPTVMGILGFPYRNHSLGIDLLKQRRAYAFFSADDKLGCIDSTYFYFKLLGSSIERLFDHKNRSYHDLMGTSPQRADSMRAYMNAMLQTGAYLLENRKY